MNSNNPTVQYSTLLALVQSCCLLEHFDVCFSCLHTFSYNEIAFALARHCPHLRWLKVHKTFGLSDTSISELADKCAALQYLDISFAGALRNPVLAGANLRYLNVSSCFHISSTSIQRIAERCLLLEHLNLDGCINTDNESIILLAKAQAFESQWL